MTDYITKLYELAGVQKGFYAYKNCDEDSHSGMPIYSGDKKFFTSYEQAEKANYFIPYYVEDDEEYYFEYPEFTADKQLKLFLELNEEWSLYITKLDNKYCICTKNPYMKYQNCALFEQALAQIAIEFVNHRYITKEKIKEILEQ